MARALDVYLHHDLAGQLIEDDGGQTTFQYAETWLNRAHATPLSQSLPLRKERFKGKECRGVGAENQEIRLAPLYDLVSTVYYPELSQDMAMRIGGEYSAGNVTPPDFERMAEEAGLAKPIVRRRVPEMADIVITALTKMGGAGQACDAVAALIRGRCETVRNSFRRS
jgi:hypothetical protein